MELPELPFPVAELAWDKYEQVQKATKLGHEECMQLMKLVCGNPPPGFVPLECLSGICFAIDLWV